ncbi:hypothetical protein HAX54_033226, partial [Datura stramonium]|nr:hypothetical protein [Datura stramonium]
ERKIRGRKIEVGFDVLRPAVGRNGVDGGILGGCRRRYLVGEDEEEAGVGVVRVRGLVAPMVMRLRKDLWGGEEEEFRLLGVLLAVVLVAGFCDCSPEIMGVFVVVSGRRGRREEEDEGGYGVFRSKSSTGKGERRGARGRGKGKGRL